jgi:ATP-dependent helicase HrpB
LQKSNTLIVNAPPGAGKSTLLPLALLDESWLMGKKIIMLEPRRLAARTISARMASLLREQPGETTGYRIRFDNRIGKNTRLEVVTEGILTRMLQDDNALNSAGLVIFDEFHERSLNAEVALALCREAQQVLRPDLRIVIMSATLDMPQLTSLLKAPSIQSHGRQYPVEIIQTTDAEPDLLPELAARTVARAVNSHDGDALVFLPGEGDIKKCAALLENSLPQISIHPLYGQLSQQEQLAAILPNRSGKRKIVLATSIAETSLTIEGVRIVVDSGFGKTSRFDPKSGLSKLETIRISKDSADQRAGRAGRLGPGVCYRMWTQATHQRMTEHRVPEIMEADLCNMALDLAQWGVHDANELLWLTPPPKASLAQAQDTLHQIGALENGRITQHGKQVHRLACHPRLAHMLLLAKDHALTSLGTDVAAILEERDPLQGEKRVDINLRVEALRRARNTRMPGNFARIEKVAASYRRMLNVDADNGPVDPFDTGLLLAYAYPERIASARPGNNAQFQLANGKYAMISHHDDLAHQPWLAVAQMDLREGLGKIFLAAPLNPKDLLPMVKEVEVVIWDTRKGGLVATRDLKIGSIVLQSKPLNNPDAALVSAAILNALKSEGKELLNFNEEMEQLQSRIGSLSLWNPEEGWPRVDTDWLLGGNTEWLIPYLNGIKTADDLKKINLSEALLHSLSWEKQQALNSLAPATIAVPSGSRIRIRYFDHGAAPILAVRLQEVFGLSDTPRVNNGKNPVVMHLLSPGYKPVQVTSDLKSFWNNLYFEVKKELQRKYPKHAWPDDPWSATAVAKGRSHK